MTRPLPDRIKSITLDELNALGLPGDTEIVWEDSSAEAHWTFREATGQVENLVLVEWTLDDIGTKVVEWERLSNVEQHKIGWEIVSDGPVSVIVLK